MTGPGGSSTAVPFAIGRYVLRERLAGGASGHVFAADDRAMDREVAVKVIATDLEDDPEARERFYREARVTAQLSHPNIVRLLDVGEERGRPFIAMERLVGLPLDRYLQSTPELTVSARIGLIVQLYSGLQAAHEQGVVHRDVKPGNIFIEMSGRLKILDFGLARLQQSTLTASGLVVGSPGFMSPEQAEGRRVDARSDIFSAAAVAYVILTGRAPFAAPTLPLALHAILHEAPAPIPTSVAPAAVARILDRAFAKSVDDRYQSCGEVLADLAALQPMVVRS